MSIDRQIYDFMVFILLLQIIYASSSMFNEIRTPQKSQFDILWLRLINLLPQK